MRGDRNVSVTDDLSSERNCVTTFELVMIKSVWQSESPEHKNQNDSRPSPVQFNQEVKGHPGRLLPSTFKIKAGHFLTTR